MAAQRIDLGSGCRASAVHTGSEDKFNECGYQQGHEYQDRGDADWRRCQARLCRMSPAIAELERQATAFSRRGDMRAAERVCREILSQQPDHLSSLSFLAELAFNAADFPATEPLLRRLIEIRPRDGGLHSRLGQSLYRQGKLAEAVVAYCECRRLSPRNSMVYLALGCLYLEMDETEQAAQVFSLGESVDRKLLQLWRQPGTNAQVADMSRRAWQNLCEHHTRMHLASVDALQQAASVQRIRDAVWPLLDSREVCYRHHKQRAQVFYFDLPETPPFYATAAMSWVAPLEAAFTELRAEILAGLDLAADGRPYLGDGHELEGEQWQGVVNSMNWASIQLYSGGVANRAVLAKFPQTLAALSEAPLATHRDNPAEVFISVLAPRTTIPEHYGVSSAKLTVHLPIAVPGHCGLKVADETRVPEEGRVLAFDDTWEHSAWNHSDRQRVVLIFEIWNPQVSDIERDAILASFHAREDWLQQRKLQQGVSK